MTSFQRTYQTLDKPLNPTPYTTEENHTWSPLHDLYPGRPMDSRDDINRYDIVHEDPEGAKRTFLDNRARTHEYAEQLQRRAVALGGKQDEKVLTHAVEDPSTVINDPDLRFSQVQIPPVQNDNVPFTVPGEGEMTSDLGAIGPINEDRQPVGFTGNGRENFEISEREPKTKTPSDNKISTSTLLTHAALGLLIILVIVLLVSVYKRQSKRR